jgi:transposase-like protein
MSSKETHVSVSEAARLAGISRSSLYKYWINGGKLSISKDARDRPCVHISELIRVFPDISIGGVDVAASTGESDTKNSDRTQELQQLVSQLEKQLLMKDALLEAKEQHLADLRQSLLLLAHKPEQDKKGEGEKRGWVKRLFG